jgi:hypothetical protein
VPACFPCQCQLIGRDTVIEIGIFSSVFYDKEIRVFGLYLAFIVLLTIGYNLSPWYLSES